MQIYNFAVLKSIMITQPLKAQVVDWPRRAKLDFKVWVHEPGLLFAAEAMTILRVGMQGNELYAYAVGVYLSCLAKLLQSHI
jgi:hypothetical protein